jgi:hypothetical protein
VTPSPVQTLPAVRLLLDAASAIGLLLLPKCPLCLMAYASMFSGLGVERLPLGRAWPMVVALMTLSLALTGYRAWRRQRLGRFAVALLGAVMLIAARWFDAPRPLAVLGLLLLTFGLLWTRWKLVPRRQAVAAP